MARLTFGAAKRQVREFIQNFAGFNKMTGDKALTVEDATIDDMLNEAYQVFAIRARTHKDYFWLQMLANTQQYTLPHDVAEIIQVTYISGLTAYEIREIHERDITWWRSRSGSPSGYYPRYSEKAIDIWPIPLFTGEWIRGYAVFTPDHIEDDTAEFQIPAEYEHAIPHYVFAHMIYKFSVLMPDQVGGKAMEAAKKYEENFGMWAEQCRSVIEDKSNVDYQMGLDSGSEDVSQALSAQQIADVRFTKVYFDPAGTVAMQSQLYGKELLGVGSNRLYWNEALLYGAEKVAITSDDQTYMFKGRRGSVYLLDVYIVNTLGGATERAYHCSSYIVTQFKIGTATDTQYYTIMASLDSYATGKQITVTVSNTSDETVPIRVQNAKRGTMYLTARFIGVC